MNELETSLKEMIIERYGSLKRFCVIISMPWTTLDSILKRGVANSNISNVLKITKELGIDAEKLVDGEIVRVPHPTSLEMLRELDAKNSTMAAHFDGSEYTEEELEDIREYAEFVKNRRNKK